jgi:hypothetical protein
VLSLPVVLRNKMLLKLNALFAYTTVLFIMQEKSCNSLLKSLLSGGMKVAVNIRMPKGMKKTLDKIAASEFRSLNSLILSLLDERLKSKGIEWHKKGEKSSPKPSK